MKIVVSAIGEGLEADVSPIFGRCAYFTFVDTETLEARSVPNAAQAASGGAGIQAAQYVVAQGAQAVLTGNVGPNAMDVLQAANVSVYPVAGSTVREAIEAFKAGKTQATGAATAPKDAGKGMLPGAGLGRGMGGGRGGGRGMGGGS
ncbi:MAG: dinitrogenase iron-molybdenum cofactor biosynthesis protein, partial [Chloroflexi bacterium]|nr:dinitrogenase iron-molybdenum cofactor biosynthesis protein [Chloroflexota bacterium]